MPSFTFTSPDGKSYTVNGPDGATQEQAFSILQRQLGQSPQQDVSAPQTDKYRQAAEQEFNSLKASGVPVDAGYVRRVAQGATLGGADEMIAAAETPFEMIRRRTLNPVEAYNYAKAFQDVQMENARKQQGALGTAAEIAGGLGSAAGLAGRGITLAKQGAGLVGNALRLGGEGALYGGTQGFLDNEGSNRLTGAAQGAATGAAIGTALPLAAAAGKAVVAPIVSNIRARINPLGSAVSHVARAAGETGRPIPQIVGDVQAGAAAGQPYTVADAMGTPGQRLLRSGMSAPGPGRTMGTEFLEQRQAGQGRRVANALVEGFQTPQTAAQTAAKLTASRNALADAEYAAVRGGASPVDLSGTIAQIDKTLAPGVNQIANPGSGIANDSVEAALSRVRNLLTNGSSVATDFSVIQRARGDLQDAIAKAVRGGENNKARLLGQVKAQLDTAMESASPGFRQANTNFARRSKAIEAVDLGKSVQRQGRVEDTIPAFRAMYPAEQSAFRAGYVDPYIAQAQSGTIGTNKAGPFTAESFQTEAPVFAPMATGNPMMQRLARENRMFATRNAAMGGSLTDWNLADQEAGKIDPGLIGDIAGAAKLSPSALSRLYTRASNVLHGYTPAVREQIVSLLLQRGAKPSLEKIIADKTAKLEKNRAIAQALLRGSVIAGSTRSASGESRYR